MKQAFIFLHGNLTTIPQLTSYDKERDIIICADGGAEHAYVNGYTPDVIIGDFDSIDISLKEKLEKKNISLIEYPREKDFTDSELAIRYALDHKIKKIYILGLLGDRVDHLLSNILFLSQIHTDSEIVILEGDMEMYILKKKITIYGKKGDEVSLIPLTSECKGITTQHLQYPLSNESLVLGSTRGISNVMIGKQSTVHIMRGILLAIHRKKSF